MERVVLSRAVETLQRHTEQMNGSIPVLYGRAVPEADDHMKSPVTSWHQLVHKVEKDGGTIVLRPVRSLSFLLTGITLTYVYLHFIIWHLVTFHMDIQRYSILKDRK